MNEPDELCMEFKRMNERQRVKNFLECKTREEYLYYSLSPLANSCYDYRLKSKGEISGDNLATIEGLNKCLTGRNMNIKTGLYNLQQLILASDHLFQKGNLFDNFRLANMNGLSNVNYNVNGHQLWEWNEKGYITLGPLDYQNITYVPTWIHDLIVFKR